MKIDRWIIVIINVDVSWPMWW